uniref:V-type proton ATPase subunit a n=1 Tax=Electrophorus electricus TaxID=8005 RepID=A0A4W4E1C2_ELEEL
MGSLFRSEEVCLVQLFLQSGSAYNCVSELGELGFVEFRDLNPKVNAFQRKFVSEVRRCEEMEKTFSFLEQEIIRCLSPPLSGPLPLPSPLPPAPQPRELLTIEEESERLARELREVRERERETETIIATTASHSNNGECLNFTGLGLEVSLFLRGIYCSALVDFIAGVIHPWKAAAFERLLWRACRGFIIVDFWEMNEKLEEEDTREMVQWRVFLISFWGKQIGQKVKKICDCFHTHTFAYPECSEERDEILRGLQDRIIDIRTVLSQTECYMQQLLARCVSTLPQWRVRVQKCKAVQAILNLCSPSVTDKCLIAEAWCPVKRLLLLQSALSGSSVESFYNRLPAPSSPPTLFNTNAFTSGFQSIVEAYGVASYREVNPAVYTIITFPFLFAVMFGDVGHGLLMTLAALWMVRQERDPKMTSSTSEMWQTVFGGRYLILLMGLFSIYTGAIYNECFSKGLSPFPSGWHVKSMNWSIKCAVLSPYLTLDPNITGVFQGPYPFGIDPIWRLSYNHLTFLNSYKMKMSVIIGVIHMTFGVCLSLFNYMHFGDMSSVYLVLIPELVFMLCLFGYLVCMVVFKWVTFGPHNSNRAPSVLIHFIDMFLFTQSPDNPPLYTGQMVVQTMLMVLAFCAIPVLLLGKPLHLYLKHRRKHRQRHCSINGRYLLYIYFSFSVPQEFSIAEAFMHQAIHTIEYCLGCISNTASYLRLWALSLAHSQLSEVLWVMVMRISLAWQGYVGSVFLAVIFSFFAMLTVSILLVMEGLSAFLHALRLHWVEFQNKFYRGTGHRLNPFSFTSNMHRT